MSSYIFFFAEEFVLILNSSSQPNCLQKKKKKLKIQTKSLPEHLVLSHLVLRKFVTIEGHKRQTNVVIRLKIQLTRLSITSVLNAIDLY